MPDVRCPGCHAEVPEGRYCVRCGAPLAASGPPRRAFAAAPHERLAVPWVVTTLFPQLPRASLAGFRTVLAVGAAAVTALTVLRLFPLALIGAALLMPILVGLYLRDVDVYEDEPPLVLAVTAGWGVLVGVGTGLLAQALAPAGAELFARPADRLALVRVVLIPALGALLAIAGPLLLLRSPKFNDVLDGATFGATAAVAVASAQVLTSAVAFLPGGVRPAGESGPWILLLATVGVAWPALMSAAVGTATAAFWQRFCAPVRDRRALGAVGRPDVATVVAVALVVAGAAARRWLDEGPALAAVAVLAAGALVLLRRAVHLGLLQEAAEAPIGPAIRCANCGASTPSHSFCISCGISLRALPKSPGPARQRGERGARFGLRGLLVRFAVALGVFLGVGYGSVLAAEPPAAKPRCPKGKPCGAPPQLPREHVELRTWTSSRLGISLDYDGSRWALDASGEGSLRLRARDFDASLLLRGGQPGMRSARRLAAGLVDDLRGSASLTRDRRPEHQILSPGLGFRPGIALPYSGNTKTPQGPNDRVTVAALAATGPRAAVAVAVVTSETDPGRRGRTLGRADSVLKSLTWGGRG
jgi:hypothetical protein